VSCDSDESGREPAFGRNIFFYSPPQQRGRVKAASGAMFHGSGSTVVDLIFSMANRDVTFFRGIVAISCL